VLRVLLTNDDSIFAPGLTELARRLAQRCEVLVVAPAKPSSAKGQSITLHKPLRLTPAQEFDCPCANLAGLNAWACTGTPADCVMLGLHHLWRGQWPHLVISGINDGPNVAQDTAYSGTVGGAMEGAISGVPGMAVSLCGHQQFSYHAAAQLVERLAVQLLYGKLSQDMVRWGGQTEAAFAGTWPEAAALELDTAGKYPAPTRPWPQLAMPTPCFNVNIPDVPLDELRGITWTRSGYRRYTDIVEQRIDPRGQEYYWIAGERVHEVEEPGTDTHALAHNYISVTPLNYNQASVADIDALAAMLERS
jgi:5'-nucleotidase